MTSAVLIKKFEDALIAGDVAKVAEIYQQDNTILQSKPLKYGYSHPLRNFGWISFISLEAKKNHLELVKLLEQWGYDISKDSTALLSPPSIKTHELIDYFAEKIKSDSEFINKDPENFLKNAVIQGDLNAIESFQERYPDYKLADCTDVFKNTLCHYAALLGNYEIYKHLSDNGVDHYKINAYHHIPLYFAVKDGQREFVKEFIKDHKDFDYKNFKDANGKMLHQIAVKHGHYELCKDLIEQGLPVGAPLNIRV